jgi:hypothetical protein
MKLKKFLLIIFIFTTCAIYYINQQTQILLISYQLEKNQTTYAYLLDRHEVLLYNVAEFKSPQNLQERLLAQRIRMQLPAQEQVVKIVKVETKPETVARESGRGFFGVLTSQTQAQAQSVK